MTAKDIIDRVVLEMERQELSLDSRYKYPYYILYAMNSARAEYINNFYRENGSIPSALVQRFIPEAISEVDLNEVDGGTDINVGKVKIPDPMGRVETSTGFPVVNSDFGLTHVGEPGPCGAYYPRSWSFLMNNCSLKGTILGNFKAYTLIHNYLYLSPRPKNLIINGIFQNPLEIPVIRNERVLPGELETFGTVYVVHEGTITHNNVTYNKGDTFVPANNTFSGSGIVKFNDKQRARGLDDDYPIDKNGENYIIGRILEDQANLIKKFFPDVKKDDKDSQSEIEQHGSST